MGAEFREFEALLELARISGVAEMRDRMYSGQPINFTEGRPVLHPVWREKNFAELLPAEEAEELQHAGAQLGEIASALHEGRLPGSSVQGKIRHLVHIGIGGSLLGPRLLCEAFPPGGNCPEIHFLSSVDALEREQLLERIEANPEDSEARYQLAARCVTDGDYEMALQQLLQILGRDRQYHDDAGRRAMLAIFNMLGEEHELTSSYRRKMFNAMH